MRKWALDLVLVGMVFAQPAPALSQAGATGSIRGGSAPVSVPEGRTVGDGARAILDQFTTCVVKRHYSPAVKALAMERVTPGQYDALHKLLDAECWGGNGLESQTDSDVEMTMAPFSFRASLFKALVKHDFARNPKPFLAQPTIAAGLTDPYLKFADCVVRSDAGGALGAVLAKAGSTEELTAVGALNPQMSQCLAPGVTLSFSKSTLLSYLAEAYYLEAQAARSASNK